MLNKTNFKTLAGKPDRWDEEMVRRHQAGEALTDIQKDQAERGRRIAMLFVQEAGKDGRVFEQTIRSGLHRIDPGPHFTAAQAIEWGKAWANEDPENREFYATKGDLPESER